jgi:hypothetical protein
MAFTRSYCRQCWRLTNECGPISWTGKCALCGLDNIRIHAVAMYNASANLRLDGGLGRNRNGKPQPDDRHREMGNQP